MLTQFFSALLLGSLLLLPSEIVSAARPTIEIVVPGFQYPQDGVTFTKATGVANNGTVTGYTNLGSFLRYADGEFSPLFNVPGASGTFAQGVNSSNLVCGYYSTNTYIGAFFYDGTTFSYYFVAGADDTWVTGINDAGDFCGYYDEYDGNSRPHPIPLSPSDFTAFADIGGTFTTISFYPDSEAVFPAAINGLGQVAGDYLAASDEEYHSFFDYGYPFDPHGSKYASIYGINDNGIKVGTYVASDNTFHSFVLKSPRLYISYDYPGVGNTYLTGINSSRLISGYYYDGGVYSGFIARLVH